MKKKLKWIVIAVVVLLIIVAVVLYLVSKKETKGAPSVNTEAVGRMDLESTVILKGTVTGTDSASVYSKSGNRIASINVKEGDYVKEGQVLCELERDESADIQLERTQIELEEAKRNLENVQFLFDNGAASEDELKHAKNSARLSELALEELEREANATVTSPIEGTVTRVNTAVGKLAGGSNAEALFQIENIEKLQMKLNVSEYEISDIRVGMEARITAEAIGKKEMKGKVESIAPTGEQKEGQSGNEMVIPVVIAVDPSEKDLFAGVTARAAIILGNIPNALTAPVDALVEEEGQTFVFVVRDGALSKEEVKVLLEGDFYCALDENGTVKEGDRLVLMPAATLEDGMQVTDESAVVEEEAGK